MSCAEKRKSQHSAILKEQMKIYTFDYMYYCFIQR